MKKKKKIVMIPGKLYLLLFHFVLNLLCCYVFLCAKAQKNSIDRSSCYYNQCYWDSICEFWPLFLCWCSWVDSVSLLFGCFLGFGDWLQ